MAMALIFFDEPIVNIVTITFTSLIFIELLNVLSEVSKPHKVMLISVSISLVLYFVSIVYFR